MPHISRRWRRATAPVALLALAGVGLSCRDSVAPRPPLQPEIREDAAPPPYSATFALGSPDDPKDTLDLNYLSERRLVRVTLTGNLTATHKDNGSSRTLTPAGYVNGDCTGRAYVIYAGNQGTYLPQCSSSGPFSTTIAAQGQGRIFRDGFGGGGGWRCEDPAKQDQYCWTLSGNQQVTVEVLEFDAVINAPSVIASPQNIWISWSPVAGTPTDVPKQTFEWWWIGTNGQRWDFTSQNGYEGTWFYYGGSGTINVRVKLNGQEKVISKYIHVGEPTLALSASPTKVYHGDTVHFRADIKPDSAAVTGLRWFWFAEQPIAGLRSGASVAQPGSLLRTDVMKAPADSAPKSSLSQTIDSVEVSSCASYRTCDYIVTARGGMRVHAIVAGTPKHAERDVDLRHVKIQLAAKPKRVIKGKRVYFTASASTSGGSPAAVGITQWTWQDASGVSIPPCATGYDSCDQLVFRSGTMRAIATVSGSTDTAFVSVAAFDCDTTGVPELDDLDARDSLDTWFQRRRLLPPNLSNYTGAERNGREGLYSLGMGGDGAVVTSEIPTPNATCYATNGAARPFTATELLGLLFHPHLWTWQDAPIPSDCREGCIWLLDDANTKQGHWDCQDRYAAPAYPRPGRDPSGKDIELDAGWPPRQGIITPDSVIVYGLDSNTPGARDVKRWSRGNWKACLAHPL